MARINQGFLGNASGKLGNVVFSKWRDLQTARQYQPDITDANSPAQQKQRTRMMALLQFLKPLNKSFIKFYNSANCKQSTPWAKAIKDNMKAIAPDGCIIPENISFGNPKFPPFEIVEATYDPFIDLLRIKYKPVDLSGRNDPYPYIDISVLGRYRSDPNNPTFDTRHMLKNCIDLTFECYSWDGQCEHTWTNHYSDGWCWFIYVDSDCMDNIKAASWTNSSPVYFKPKPIIDGFNLTVTENPVPTDAISWEYKMQVDQWVFEATIDPNKITLENPENHTIIAWFLAFANGKYYKSEANEWSLSEFHHQLQLGGEGFKGSMVCLYAVYNNEGEQVGKFNSFYINGGTDAINYDLQQQIFDCNYATPLSFVLNDNKTGFCGSIDELFGEFIQLWEQGVIYDHSSTQPPVIRALKAYSSGNGKVNVEGYESKDKIAYYFLHDKTAMLTLSAFEGSSFDNWTGDDAADVIKIEDNIYSIKMDKDRTIIANFIINP